MDRIFLFLLCFYFCSAKIKINKLDVPSAILYGSRDDVILDCDFDSGGDTVTEIKWFRNGDNQIYQWLPGENVPAQALGDLKNHIDVTYRATDDNKTMHRALHIRDLSPKFSGNYTCKVSGWTSEDVETKTMIIYVIPDDDDYVDEIDDDDDFLNVTISKESREITCGSGGYFPRPNMTLYITDDNDTELLRQDDETVVEIDDDLYNVTATLKFDSVDLPRIQYTCELSIPGTPYNITETGIIQLEDSSETQAEEVDLSEDFDLFNSTNSTESSFEELKANAAVRCLPTLLATALLMIPLLLY